MKFTGICPITEETASIDIHPIYCGSNENPGFYTKGDIRFCTIKGPRAAPMERTARSSRTHLTYSASTKLRTTTQNPKGV